MNKLYLAIVLVCFASACNGPATITANPADPASTSGTLGSAKGPTEVLAPPNDTIPAADTTIRRDSL